MTTSEVGWAADLCLDLDAHDTRSPLTVRLQAAIRSAIRSGRLTSGAKVPPSRVLAGELGCSRSVVVAAYEQLITEGYLQSRQGSGTTVTPLRSPAGVDRAEAKPPPARYNFSPGVADLSQFPRTDWHKSIQHVMTTASRDDFYYTGANGNAQFRAAIAERLARVRGASVDSRNIHACAGTVQAVSLLARYLVESGHRTVGVENPSWPRLRPPLEAAGLRLVPVPVDREGLVVSELRQRSEVRAVLTTPAHQFPTGRAMSARRREELLAWATAVDGVVAEDDYDAEFNYGPATTALQAQAPDRVVYLGTTSKILSPALRMGWMVTPDWMTGRLNDLRPGLDLGISVIDQLALTHLITTGILDRHLRKARPRYNQRRQMLAKALQVAIPGVEISSAPTGLHLLAGFPPGADEGRIVTEAARRSVLVFGLASYFVDGPGARPPTLLLGYASLDEGSIAAGVNLIAESWRAACPR